MDDYKFKRVFDQVKLSPEQEKAMLRRLLAETERTGKKSMKWTRKVTVVLAAAALLLVACAFTVATGVDQRLLSLFRGGEQDTQMIADGVVSVEDSYTYENGWTVKIGQVLVDRYSLAVLVDFIGPEGMVLDADDYLIDLHSDLMPEPGQEDGVGGFVSGSILLEDEDEQDNRLSFLWYRGPTTYLASGTQEFIGLDVALRPLWIERGGGRDEVADFRDDPRTVTVELPDRDSGRVYQMERIIQVGEEEMVLEELYLSPISVSLSLRGAENDPRMWGPPELSDMWNSLVLNLANGESVVMGQSVSQSYNPDKGTGQFVLQTERVIEPEDVVSVTILDQTISLEGLAAAEDWQK